MLGDVVVNKRPLISVVVPAYNCESTICETLQSVTNQTYTDIEIIVIDDGSTDQTCVIVEKLSMHDKRIVLLRKTNGGPASARNLGISVAKGEFVAPIDSDDLWSHDKLSIQLATLTAAGDDYAFAYSPCRLINSESNVFRSLPLYFVNGNSFNQLCYYNFTQNGSSMLVRLNACKDIGGYDERKSVIGREDILFALNLAAKYKVVCATEYLVGYRQLDTSLSKNIKKMHYASIEVLNTVRKSWKIDKRVYNWAINPTRIRWMYQNRKEGRIDLLSFRLLLGALIHDPRATLHSGKKGALRALGPNGGGMQCMPFEGYSITSPAQEDLPSFVVKRLEWLAFLDRSAPVQIFESEIS